MSKDEKRQILELIECQSSRKTEDILAEHFQAPKKRRPPQGLRELNKTSMHLQAVISKTASDDLKLIQKMLASKSVRKRDDLAMGNVIELAIQYAKQHLEEQHKKDLGRVSKADGVRSATKKQKSENKASVPAEHRNKARARNIPSTSKRGTKSGMRVSKRYPSLTDTSVRKVAYSRGWGARRNSKATSPI